MAAAIHCNGVKSGPLLIGNPMGDTRASQFISTLVSPPQMNACLRENKAKLSDACRKVVESHGG